MSPSFVKRNLSIDTSSSSLELLIATHHMQGGGGGGVFANGSAVSMANKYLFANLLLFGSGEGDEATSPSFATKNATIDASNALLEVLIAI